MRMRICIYTRLYVCVVSARAQGAQHSAIDDCRFCLASFRKYAHVASFCHCIAFESNDTVKANERQRNHFLPFRPAWETEQNKKKKIRPELLEEGKTKGSF